MKRLLVRMLDETEFLSDFGIRGVSKHHERNPFVFEHAGSRFGIGYVPGESDPAKFGGKSNWRGPIWMPVNYLIIESLRSFHRYYGDEFRVGCPAGSGRYLNLVTWRPSFRAACQGFFCSTPTAEGPVFGDSPRHADDPAFRDNVLFYEYFHGDTGRVRRSRPSDWLDRPRRATAAAAGRRRRCPAN